MWTLAECLHAQLRGVVVRARILAVVVCLALAIVLLQVVAVLVSPAARTQGRDRD